MTARELLSADGKPKKENYLVLKHDVETKVKKAYRMACIENRFGHRGSYYVQAYLLKDQRNIALLQKMQSMGHEISYHYDVLDSCRGDFDAALNAFKENKAVFEACGFHLETVCQHGNPVAERIGYTSNRDFFRNDKVQKEYPTMADIMVDFEKKAHTDYLYFSDAGRRFQLIFDPINNDVMNSDDQNIPMKSLDDVMAFKEGENRIISTHPHRWTPSAFGYVSQLVLFKTVKGISKIFIKIPFMKKLMSRYFYLAKKF